MAEAAQTSRIIPVSKEVTDRKSATEPTGVPEPLVQELTPAIAPIPQSKSFDLRSVTLPL